MSNLLVINRNHQHAGQDSRPVNNGSDGRLPPADTTAILDRFLHHAEVITITGKSYRLRNKSPHEENPQPPAARTPAAQSTAAKKKA